VIVTSKARGVKLKQSNSMIADDLDDPARAGVVGSADTYGWRFPRHRKGKSFTVAIGSPFMSPHLYVRVVHFLLYSLTIDY
jgi:hypothetical protein